MWVKFTKDFPWKPSSQQTILYRSGSVMNVKAEVGDLAVARGAAVKMKKSNKGDTPTEEGDGQE